jgi:hypothetical protein
VPWHEFREAVHNGNHGFAKFIFFRTRGTPKGARTGHVSAIYCCKRAKFHGGNIEKTRRYPIKFSTFFK